MRFLLTAKLCVLGLLSCAATGCVSFAKPAPAPAKQNTEAQATKAVNDLPNTESARACLAAADGLEQGGKDMEATQLYEKARQYDPKLNLVVARRLAELYDRVGM